MASLTCYRLRTPPDGPVGGFDDAIDEKKLGSLATAGPKSVGFGTAKLFVSSIPPHEPDWGRYVRSGFGDEVDIPRVSNAAAVLVVCVEREGHPYFVAFTFGYGHMLLRPDAYERGFGLKTALNVIFEGDDGTQALDPARLRSADAKRVGPTVLRSRHQVSGSSSLEELDVDVRRDLLGGVTGKPVDSRTWGSRISGRDALYVSAPVAFGDLDGLVSRIAAANDAIDYQVRFSFVDDMQLETDPVTKARLQEEVLASLQAEITTDLDLAPPELVDWEQVSRFQFHTDRRKRAPLTRPEIRLADYLASLNQTGQLGELTIDRLKGYDVFAVDGTGQVVTRWSAWRCLYGQVDLDGNTYVLDDGDFYLVSQDYLDALDDELKSLPDLKVDLPEWPKGQAEGKYNEEAAGASGGLLLLDKKMVKVATQTSPVEICDLLSDEGQLIHVKRREAGSSGLSHLFMQGFVSGDLLVGNNDFRTESLSVIEDAERKEAGKSGVDRFSAPFAPGDFHPASCEVSFAILGGRTPTIESLPFFSKVALRQVVDDLRRRGLKVSVRLVPSRLGL